MYYFKPLALDFIEQVIILLHQMQLVIIDYLDRPLDFAHPDFPAVGLYSQISIKNKKKMSDKLKIYLPDSEGPFFCSLSSNGQPSN